MRKLLIASLLIVMSCSSQQESNQQTSAKCMEIIKNTKIKAPRNIKYMGVYSNTEELKAPSIDRYTIRIVNDGRDCQAILMDYMDKDRPQFTSYSKKFDCKQKQVLLKSSLAFHRPHKKQLPIKRSLTIKTLLLPDKNAEAIAFFPNENEWEKPTKIKLTLTKQKDIDEQMAPFDWETIKMMSLKAKCFREKI